MYIAPQSVEYPCDIFILGRLRLYLEPAVSFRWAPSAPRISGARKRGGRCPQRGIPRKYAVSIAAYSISRRRGLPVWPYTSGVGYGNPDSRRGIPGITRVLGGATLFLSHVRSRWLPARPCVAGGGGGGCTDNRGSNAVFYGNILTHGGFWHMRFFLVARGPRGHPRAPGASVYVGVATATQLPNVVISGNILF